MKRLLNTLYVTSHNRYLSLDGENIVVLEKEKEVGRVPLHNLEAIVTFGYTGASPALMGACAERNIGLTFLSGNGRFIARVTGEVYGNVTLRKEQYRRSESEEESLKIARNCIAGKVYNSRWIVERAARDYPLRLDVEKLKKSTNQDADIKDALEALKKDNAYLFEDDSTPPPYAGGTGRSTPPSKYDAETAKIMAAAGLDPEKD